MLKRLVFVLVTLAATSVFAQSGEVTTAPKSGALLTWEKATYDFGEIKQGDKVEYTFRFVNGGTEPLIITNVSTQCGCTAPRGWPRDPVQPGSRGEITLVFDSTGKFGRVNKVATIVSNASNKESSQLLLSGNILEKKASN